MDTMQIKHYFANNPEQREAMGNFLTVISRYKEQFEADIWDVFADYNPTRNFKISGASYYRALSSIPDVIKADIVCKIISIYKFNSKSPRELFASIATLKLCTTSHYFVMNIIINVLDVFSSFASVQYQSAKRCEDIEVDTITLLFSNQGNRHGLVQMSVDRDYNMIFVSIHKSLLQGRYHFTDYPNPETLRNMANELLCTDSIGAIHCYWIQSAIRNITAQDAASEIKFNLSNFVVLN